MQEYQFSISCRLWLDVEAETKEEAVEKVNSSLHLLEEPLSAPGEILRVVVDINRDVVPEDVEIVYKLPE